MITLTPFQIAHSELYTEYSTSKDKDSKYFEDWLSNRFNCIVEVFKKPIDTSKSLIKIYPEINEYRLLFNDPNQELIFRLKYL